MKKLLQRKRRSASTLLATLMTFFLFVGVSARGQGAPDPEKDYAYEPYTYGSASGVIITAYLGNEAIVTTPTSLGGQPVIAIGPGVPRVLIDQDMGPGGEPKGFCNTPVTDLTISEGVLFIADAGLGNDALIRISLPASLQELGGNPFFAQYNAPNAELVITVAAGNPNFAIEPNSGALIQNGTHLIFWPTLAARAAAVDGLLTIPDGVTHIGTRILAWNRYYDPDAHANVYAFTRIAFPASVTHIADCAFYACHLESLTLPTSLTSLGLWVSFTALDLPAGLAHLGGHPSPTRAITLAAGNPHFRMENGYLLNSAGDVLYAAANAEPPPGGRRGVQNIPASVKRIAKLAMYGEDVSGMTLPAGLKTIEDGAFADSFGWSVAPTQLPNSITTIGENAFIDTDFAGALPTSLTSLGRYAFALFFPPEHFPAPLTNIVTPPGLKEIPEGCFARLPGYPELNLTLSEGLEVIGKNAFRCAGLSTVLLPASLRNMDATAFLGLATWEDISPLIAYEVAPGNTHLKAIDGVLFSADGKSLLAWPQSKTPNYQIPDGTEQIGPYAFANSYLAGFNDGLPSAGLLMVPASVTQFHASTFNVDTNYRKQANAYFLGPAPELSGGAGHGPMVINYNSAHQASWEAKLDEGAEPPTYGGYAVSMFAGGGGVIVPTIARQDGVSGDAEPFFRNQLVLLAGMEGTDTNGVTLRYTLDGFKPTTDSPAVENGTITLNGGYATVSLAPFRALGDEELPCGPTVTRRYIDTSAINAALDNDDLDFSTDVIVPWTPDNSFEYGSPTEYDRMESFSKHTTSRESWLQTSVTGPGMLSFWWRASLVVSDFTFAVDGVNQLTYDDRGFWHKEYVSIEGEGQHTLRWAIPASTYYSCDLDLVSWTPAGESCFVYEQVEDGLKLVAYTGNDTHVTIPDVGDGGQTIVEIDALAFGWHPNLQSISFPTQSVNIANYYSTYGLRSCRNLESIFFRGAPPEYPPWLPCWTTMYYPYDYDEGLGEDEPTWADFLYNHAYGDRIFLPIAFPIAAAPIISYPDTTRGTSSTSFTDSLEISIDAPDEDTVVRYTTDGSYPNAGSRSESPLTITNTTIITARAFRNINGDYLPCSAITRRSFVNTDEFNEAVGLGAEGFSFTTVGDQPWINKMMPHSDQEESPAVGTERLRPGQSSSLFLDFTMEDEGIVSFVQYYSEYSSSASFVIYDADDVPVQFTKTSTRLGYSRWYKHTLNLPAGIYTAVWTLTVPDTIFYGPTIAIDNFRAGNLRCTLTLLCEPEEGGTTYANNVQGSDFEFLADQDVTIKAVENDDYLFTHWNDGDDDGDDDVERTITVLDPTDQPTDPNTYTAHFVEAAYIATAAEPANGGYVNGGKRKYPLDEEVTLGAYGNSGWRFDRWLDDDDDPVTEPIPYRRSFTCTPDDRNRSYTAVFTPVIEVEAYAYYLTADGDRITPGGGSFEGTGTYDVADANTPIDVTLIATPESDDFTFLGWDDNQNNVIDEDEERNPERTLQLTWAELAGDYYYFNTRALFARSSLVIVDYYEAGDQDLGSITAHDGDGNEIPLAELQAGKRLPVGSTLTLTANAKAGARLREWRCGSPSHSQSYQSAPTITVPIFSYESSNRYYANFIRVIAYQASLAAGSPEGSAIVVKDYSSGTEMPLAGAADLDQTIVVTVTAPDHRIVWHDGDDQETRYFSIREIPEDNVFTASLVPTYTVVLDKLPADCYGPYVRFSGLVGTNWTFDLGTESSFYAAVNQGQYWRFVKWTDGNTQSNRSFNPEKIGTYPFTAEFERYVSIYAYASGGAHTGSFTGTGDYVVTDTPKEVTVTATPAEGYRFDRWTDNGAANLADPTNPVRVLSISTADTSISLQANFIRVVGYQVSLAPDSPAGSAVAVKDPQTGAELPLTGPCDFNQTILVTVTAPEHHRIVWHDGNSQDTRTFTIGENPEYNVFTVGFVATYTVVLDKLPADSPDTYVAFNSGGATTRSFDLGTETSFYARVTSGKYWRFVKWTDDNAQRNRSFKPENSDTYTFTAEFERYVRIQASVAPNNYYYAGTFTGTGDHVVTDTPKDVTVIATPNAGYRFDRWIDNGAANLTDAELINPVRVLSVSTADTDIALIANFVKTYQVTVGVYPGSEGFGAITEGALSNATIDEGSQISFTAMPNPGGQFIKWWFNGYAQQSMTDATQTVTITRDSTYLAEFTSEANITVNIAAGQEDWGCQAGVLRENDLVPSGAYAVGFRYTLEARPAPNHRFVRWSDGRTSSQRSILLTAEGFTVTAEFAQTATVTMDFKTDPAELPAGTAFPSMRYTLGNYPRCTFQKDNPDANMHSYDVGTYTVRYSVYGDWIAPVEEEVTLNVGDNLVLDRSFTLITAGNLTGYLSPSEIAGAWRIKSVAGEPDGPWQNSGATINVEAGVHTIEFKPVAGWLTPAEREVTVIANRSVSFNAPYSAIVPGVELSFSPSEVSEAAGPNAAVATLRRIALDGNPINLDQALTVTLSVSEANALILPSRTIQIPAGKSETQFPIGVIDNNIVEDFINDEDGNPLAPGRLVQVNGKVVMSPSCNCSGLPTDGNAERAIQAEIILWDDDSPALSVTVAPSTLPERDELYPQALTISRNDETPDGPVTVHLSAYVSGNQAPDNGTEIQFWLNGAPLPLADENEPGVFLVEIPAEQRNVKLDVLACNDGVEDGNQVISVFADADNYAPGSAWLMVSDLSFPDYTISAIATPPAALESGSSYQLQLTLSNVGNMDAPIGLQIPIAVHISRNNITALNNRLLHTHVGITEEQPLPRDGSIEFVVTVDLRDPADQSDIAPANNWRFAAIVNPDKALREVSTLNNTSWSGPFTLDASYTALLSPLPVTSILPNEELVLNGQTVKSANDLTPVPDVDVDVYVICQGFRRVIKTTSDADGTFSVLFTPTVSERGHVIAGACYPNINTNAVQQEFDVLALRRGDGSPYLRWDLIVNTPKQYSFKLVNPCQTALTGLDFGTSNVSDRVLLDFPGLPESLAGGESITLNYTVTATEPSPGRDYELFQLFFTSAEGARLNIPVYFFAIAQFGTLALEPASIDTTMQIGVSRDIEVSIKNIGAADTGPVTITTPELSWLSLPAGDSIPNILPGESVPFIIRLCGDATTPLGAPLSGAIAINAENVSGGVRLPFRVTAVSDARGSLAVTVIDDHTFYEADKPKVQNAGVTVKNPYTGAILATGNTGDSGICVLRDLPVGKAQVLVSAEKHANGVKLVDIAPGFETALEVFLGCQAISYNWDVVPTEIEDEYEVVLTPIYETNVPVPVVRTEMPSDFRDMLPGSSRMINAVLTNEGLVNAYAVRLDFQDAGSFTFECLQPDEGLTLAPQQSSVLPVIVRHAAAGTRADNPCTTWVATVYYHECGPDFRWHRYPKQVLLEDCHYSTVDVKDNLDLAPVGSWGVSGDQSPYSFLSAPGTAYNDAVGVSLPSLPSLPSIPNSCVPCQNNFFDTAYQCARNSPPATCITSISNTIDNIVTNYDQGTEGWANIAMNTGLTGLGCGANAATGPVGGALGCVRGFVEACGGLEGRQPLRIPWPGDIGNPAGGGTRGDTRNDNPSWMKDIQEKAYVAYRQGAAHAALTVEYYGSIAWLDCQTVQLKAFNDAFHMLSQQYEADVPEDAPELLAVLPENLSTDDLAAFVARWNRTIAYWRTLPGGPGAELPGGTDNTGADIIDLSRLLECQTEMKACENEAQRLGYDSVRALIEAQYRLALDQKSSTASVCAKVTLEIKQKITMTREAFDGTLTMSNGHEAEPITALGLQLKVTDLDGNDCTDLFEIFPLADQFNGISAIDGTGTLAAKATGQAVVRFIPERGAAPEVPIAYNFGGTLTYVNPFSGATAVVELTPCTLTVNPSPSLQIHYFLQRDVLGDDPLTKAVIEPSYPAELAALVYNDGFGVARNFRIDSGQPQIIDNEKGLLIDFALWDYETTESMLNGTPNYAPLGQVNLGNIQPKTTGLAQWWLTSSLLGHFVGMEARYSHLNSHGNPELSLIESVDIHELIRSGKALDRDTTIFLVNDIVDGEDLPDTLWFQDTALSADVLTGKCDLLDGPTFNINADPPTVTFQVEVLLPGWHYIAMADPANSGAMPGERRYEVAATFRNGTPNGGADIELPFRNCWQTDRTLPDGADPINENKLHLMDYLEEGIYNYTIALTELPAAAVRVTQFAAFSNYNEDVNNYIVVGDVDEVTVLFNTKIDPATFTTDDITLRRQGVIIPPAELAAALTIQADPDDEFELSYIISGLSAFTNQDGFFVLTVQCAGIADPWGFFGAVGKQLMWVRQHDFGGNNATAPSLFSMERLVPEAGMEGEFDVKLSFLGDIDPETVTTAGLLLKKNGQVINLPADIIITQDPDNLNDFFIKGLGVLPTAVDSYSLRYDASAVKDILGTGCTGSRFVGWGNDVTPPAPIAELFLEPDTGRSATDRITQLAADELLTLAGILPELPCFYQLFVEPADGGDRDAITDEIFALEGSNGIMSIDFNLPEGAYTLTLVLKDEVGNSTEQQLSLLIDNTAPDAITNLELLPDTGIAGDFITQLAEDADVVLSGTLPEKDLTVTVAEGDTVLGTKTCEDDDQTFALAFPLAEGVHDLVITITDQAGNSTTLEQTIIIDNTAPSTSDLVMTPDTGIADDFITQLPANAQLTFSGILTEKRVTVAVIEGPNTLATKTCEGDDQAFALSFPLDEGKHKLVIVTTDQAGNSTQLHLPYVYIDNTAPDAFIDLLAISPDSGVAGDFITSLAEGAEIALSGILPEKLLTVSVSKGETILDSYTCEGYFQDFTLGFPLAEGVHDLVITITDQAGNSTVLNQTIVIDNTFPSTIDLTMTPDTGVAGDFITQLPADAEVTFSGTLSEKRVTITISEGENVLATKTCEGDDQAFALSFPLAEGKHVLHFITTDPAGNTSTFIHPFVIIDNTAPDVITDLGITPDTGVQGDFITQLAADAKLTLGAAPLPETLLTVTVTEGNTVLASKTCEDDDRALDLAFNLAEGTHHLVITTEDVAGNRTTLEQTVVIDNTAPTTANLTMTPDTGAVGDFITQLAVDELLIFSGALSEERVTTTISEGETVLASMAREDDVQSFDLAFPLAEGVHALVITTTDQAGNRTVLEQTVIIDNSAPSLANLTMTPDTGATGDFITQLPADAQLTFSGTLSEKRVTVTITEGGNTLATKTCEGDDQAFSLAFSLAEGKHNLAITSVDQAGNTSIRQQPVVIDNTAPGVADLTLIPDHGPSATDGITTLREDEELSLAFQLSESPVHITLSYRKQGSEKLVVLYEQDYPAEMPLEAAVPVYLRDDGSYTLVLNITDQAGNSTILEKLLVIDNVAPSTLDLTMTPDTGVAGDFITQLAANAEVTLSGTLSEKQVTITISKGDTVLATKTCEGDDQAFALSFPLAEGKHTLIIATTDQAGNGKYLYHPFVIDNTAPDAITGLLIMPDTGVPDDFITQLAADAKLTLGAAPLPETLLTVTVTEGDTVLATKTCEDDDQALDLAFNLAEGTHHLVITTEDVAGNSTTLEQTVVIDNTAPTATNLALTPDHGKSDADGITWLADDEELALAFQLSESPVLVTLSYRVQGSEDSIVLYEEDHSAEAPQQLSIPVDLRDEGSYTLILNVADLAGNEPEEVTLPLQIDATPLTVTISDMPTRPGDANSFVVTFSDEIVNDEFTIDNVTLSFGDIPCTELTLTRVDGKTYTIGNIPIPPYDDDLFMLGITLYSVHKLLSGHPGEDHVESWPFAFDNPYYNWQAGWNAIFLPFNATHQRTEEGLAVMPRFRVVNGAMVISDELPLRSALWVFCADPDAAPALRGEFCADREPAIPALTPGEWTFIGPLREILVPEDTTAWEWRNGKYVQAQTLLPGQAYWLFQEAPQQ